MGQDIIAGALALALAFTPITPSNSATLQNPQIETVKPQERAVSVKNGDTLSVIAEKTYGSKDYWTNIWNDNPWINNPNYIEKEWKLKIRIVKTKKPEELKPDLAKKIETERRLAYASEAIVRSSVIIQQSPAVAAPSPVGPLNDAQMNYLGNCESGMRPSTNTGNGFYGAFQFTYGTWNRMETGYARADLAPIEVQKDAVQKLVSRSNIYGQFPACSQKMRASGLL